MTKSRKSTNVRRLHAVTASAIPVIGLLLSATGFAADTTWKGGGTDPDVIKDSTNWTTGVPATNKEGLIATSDATLYWGDASTSLGGGETLGALTIDSPTLTAINATALQGTETGSMVFSIAFVGNTGNTIPLISLGPDVTQAVSINDTLSPTPITILNLQLGQASSGIGVSNASAVLTISSRVLSKSGVTSNLVKTGAGELVLSSVSNSFTGQVQISGGTLAIAASTNLGTAANTVELDGGAFSIQPISALTLARSVIVDSNGGTITTSATNSTTLSSPFGGSGTVVKNGAAELILNNSAGTFNGTINVAQGNLRLINPGSTAAGTTVQLTGTNSTLNLRADADSVYNANVEAITAPVQIFVANQSPGITGHTLSVGSVKLASTLNIGATAATNYIVGASQVNLAGNGTISTTTTNMNVTGGIAETVAGSVFTKAGPANLTINGSTTYTGGTKVLAGNLILKGAGAWNAALNGPGVTDVQNGNINGNGTLTFDYTSTTTPVSSVRSAIRSGQIEDSVATAGSGLGYADDGTSQVKVLPTYLGDATLNGIVDVNDFDALSAHYGESDSSVSWANGDFNYDGTVNALDFNALATNYGLPAFASQPAEGAVALGALVPEPASLMSIAMISLLGIRRRRAI